MNLLDRAIGWASPEAGLRRQTARAQIAAKTRLYDAATPSRQTAPWRRPFTSSRSETYLALPWLRASAHDLARNDPHSAKAIGTLAVDLVGTGILPKADSGNKRLNRKIDAVMAEALKAIDADGITPNFAGFQLLAARTFFEDGEAILRKRVRPTKLGLSVPLQFSLLEGEYLDNQLNEAAENGNRIVQGIELDDDGLRVAYHLFRQHPGDTYMAAVDGSYERSKVPVSDVRIIMEPQRAGQLRGVPWITSTLLRAKQLADYEDAERQRKQIESSIPAIVNAPTQVGEASDPNTASLFPTVVDADGNLVERVEGGRIAYVRNGGQIEFMKPADAMGYGPFKRTELQSIAAGARSTYELISGDLSQTNFSSYQAGHLPYRSMIEVVRATIFVPQLEWIWGQLVDMAILVGKLPEGTSKAVKWHAPPWLPIDPQKQAEADLVAIRSGVKTLYEVVTAGGKDFDDHLDELAAANKALDKRKIVLDSDPRETDKRGVKQGIAPLVKGNPPAPDNSDPDAA